MRFNPDLKELIPLGQLDAAFGGEFKYEFEKTSYWDQIVRYAFTPLFTAIHIAYALIIEHAA